MSYPCFFFEIRRIQDNLIYFNENFLVPFDSLAFYGWISGQPYPESVFFDWISGQLFSKNVFFGWIIGCPVAFFRKCIFSDSAFFGWISGQLFQKVHF